MLDNGMVRAISSRDITQATAEHWNYLVYQAPNGSWYQAAVWYEARGFPVAAKLRDEDKNFVWYGDHSKVGLWGKHLWPDSGKMVVVTEGELDALSMSQVFGNKWPVVSLPDGAATGKKSIAKDLAWLNGFERVVFMFDMDEPGREAAEACARILPPGKAYIANLPLKDANEMLMAGRTAELEKAAWKADLFRPDGIVSADALIGEVLSAPKIGLSWPWEFLTDWTYGRRYGELYTLGAATGAGKTDWASQVVAHTISHPEEKEPCAVFAWEAAPFLTFKSVLGKLKERRFHIPPDLEGNKPWTDAELRDAVSFYQKDCAKLFINDHHGAIDWDSVKERLRFLARAEGVRHAVLDPLTALSAIVEDERRELERIMAEAASLAHELDICLYMLSHLATPEGGDAHEEGARVKARHLKGSRAIMFWSNFIFGLERDQQLPEEDPDHNVTTLRCLKDRYTGQALGRTKRLRYNEVTGILEADFIASVAL